GRDGFADFVPARADLAAHGVAVKRHRAGYQVVDLQVVFRREVNGFEGFLEVGTGARHGSVRRVKRAIYDLQVLQRCPDPPGDSVRHEAADTGQRLEQSISLGLAPADVGAGLYLGIDDVLLMAVEPT